MTGGSSGIAGSDSSVHVFKRTLKLQKYMSAERKPSEDKDNISFLQFILQFFDLRCRYRTLAQLRHRD